jgi:hypothetical protein
MGVFYFNTGVRPAPAEPPWHKEIVAYPEFGQVVRGGTIQIKFEADAPEGSQFIMSCDNPDLPESKLPDVLVCKVTGGHSMAKYAYFRIPKTTGEL